MLAGIDVFKKYGDAIVVDSLANGELWRWKDIEALPVYEVIFKKAMEANRVLYERRLQSIMNPNKS